MEIAQTSSGLYVDETVQSSTHMLTLILLSTPKPRPTSPLIKIIDNSISPFLVWPHSPKRKGKRQIERTPPYALASSKYRKILEVKRSLELKKEQEKENKNEKRE